MTEEAVNPIEKIAEEARDEFDLDAALDGRPMRSAEDFRVLTDEVTAEQLGWAEPIPDRVTGMPVGFSRRGVIGSIHRLRAEDEENVRQSKPREHEQEILDLLDEAEALRDKLNGSSITLELRAIPLIIKKDARRAAKAELKITGKGIPEAQEEDFVAEENAQILQRTLVAFTPAKSGVKVTEPTIKHARSFLTKLPESEIIRLKQKLADLNFTSVIGASATEDADF